MRRIVPGNHGLGCSARRRRRAWSSVLLVLVLLTHSSCGEGSRGTEAAVQTATTAEIEVATVVVRRADRATALTVPGSLVARRESEIGAEVTGRIDEVFVDVGDRLEAGDPLFLIDPSSYEARVQGAEAAVARALADRRQAGLDVARGRALYEREAISQERLDHLETSLLKAVAVEAEADARLSLALRDLERTRVTSPYAGTVKRRLADEGTSARVMPQTLVLVIQESGSLEAHARIPESHRRRIRPGDAAIVRVEEAFEPIHTTINSIADHVEPDSRTVLVRMNVPNECHCLKAGAFVRVELELQSPDGAVWVPHDAIRSQEGRHSVLRVQEGHAVEVPVELGRISEQTAEVVSGLESGDDVVVAPAASSIRPGAPVRIRSSPGART